MHEKGEKSKEKNNLNFGTLCSWENIKIYKPFLLLPVKTAQGMTQNAFINVRSHGREST